MSSLVCKNNRLWVQAIRLGEKQSQAAEAAGLATVVVADLIASGVGAIVKSAADRLIASDQYVVKAVLAHEPSFLMCANMTTASFLLKSIILNVGCEPIPICDETNQGLLPFAAIKESRGYHGSPVVIWLNLEASTDGTALAPRVKLWKYEQFLDPTPEWFRKPRRKVTVEVKISDVEGLVLLATAVQVEADRSTLRNAGANLDERLPWVKRPVKNFTGERVLNEGQEFGPVNIEASITEVAEPSGFARILGTSAGNQKAAIEGYAKGRITRFLDGEETARAKVASFKEAATARDEYGTAFTEAVEARKAFDAAADGAAKTAAQLTLTLKLATLRQKEILARAAFDHAGLAFEPMPAM